MKEDSSPEEGGDKEREREGEEGRRRRG
jgi:hypothetical protein